MLIDCHSHIWEPEHITPFAEAEMRRAGGWLLKLIEDKSIASVKRHAEATKMFDKVIAFGWPGLIDVPNEYVARYSRSSGGRVIGFASINPMRKDAVIELKECYRVLGLRGVKLYPILHGYFVNDEKLDPFYEAVHELGIPIILHMSTTFVRSAPLKYSQPMLLDDVAIKFPDIKFIIAHVGWPKEMDTLSLLRKHPNVYADISTLPVILHYRFYNVMYVACSYNVQRKLLFGTDWPLCTAEDTIRALKDVNIYSENTKLPRIPEDAIKSIIEENAEVALKDILFY